LLGRGSLNTDGTPVGSSRARPRMRQACRAQRGVPRAERPCVRQECLAQGRRAQLENLCWDRQLQVQLRSQRQQLWSRLSRIRAPRAGAHGSAVQRCQHVSVSNALTNRSRMRHCIISLAHIVVHTRDIVTEVCSPAYICTAACRDDVCRRVLVTCSQTNAQAVFAPLLPWVFTVHGRDCIFRFVQSLCVAWRRLHARRPNHHLRAAVRARAQRCRQHAHPPRPRNAVNSMQPLEQQPAVRHALPVPAQRLPLRLLKASGLLAREGRAGRREREGGGHECERELARDGLEPAARGEQQCLACTAVITFNFAEPQCAGRMR
jgi:hypothetical protein